MGCSSIGMRQCQNIRPFPLLKKWVEYFRQYAKTIAGLLVFFAVPLHTPVFYSAHLMPAQCGTARFWDRCFWFSGLSTGLALNPYFCQVFR
ncbi:MAG: hypothetical protein R3C26_05575 [Calditrichia bacterium]